MNTTRIMGLLMAATAGVALGMLRSEAATVTLSLDVYYGDSNGDNVPDVLAPGSWQLVAHTSVGDNRGLSALDTALVGVVNGDGPSGSTFRAPDGSRGFKLTFGAKPWFQDQDANASTHDMLFGQVPESSPGPQDLFYDVGQQAAGSIKASNDPGQPAVSGPVVTWNFNDPLGDFLADADQSDNDGEFQRGVIMAQGRFTAGSVPAFVPNGSTANVFTALGTQTNPPPVNSIQQATATLTLTRNNLFTFSGDVNLDHDVDATAAGGQGDGQILTLNLGRTGDVLWQEGDLNGDKDADIFQSDGKGDAQILTSALGLGGSPPAAAGAALAAAQTATATYNPSTGALTVDVGAGVGAVGFSTAGLFNLASNPQLSPPTSRQFDASTLGFFNGGNALPTGAASLGAVLPGGLGAGQIVFGYTPIGLPSVFAPVAVVPEPGTLVGLAVGALAMCRMLGRRC